MNINVNVSLNGVEDNNARENSNGNGAKRISETETMHLRKCYEVVDKISDDTDLYRYMNYYKLESMFKESCIYFSNTKENLDKRERQIPDRCYRKYNQDTKIFNKRINNEIQNIIQSYLTCWTKAKDSYAIWKIYNPSADGCCIHTTFKELKEQLKWKDIVFFNVEYIDATADESLPLPAIAFKRESRPGTIRGIEKYKIKPYAYEEELRGVLYSKEDCDGILVDINPADLIKSVMLNPFSTDEAQARIKQLIDRYIPNVKYEESKIDE